MASEGPSKADILAIFKRLRSIQTNKQCFDCGASNPTWASVTYGVFLCIDCSATHRSLGVHVTFIRSTQLDTSWTWTQLRAMQVGGNACATAFFRQHGCSTSDSQQKYHSRAATMYREKLHALALKAMKLHGTKIHIDSHHQSTDSASPSPHSKEVDFFKEHAGQLSAPPTGEANGFTTRSNTAAAPITASNPVPISNGSNGTNGKPEEPIDPSVGPSVEAALSMSPTQALMQQEPRKATIGQRKPAGAKKGKSLGAQRVKTNFNDIENAAAQRDKDKEQLAAMAIAQEANRAQEDSKRMANMKLAYKDLNLEEKKRDEQMKKMDPKKKAQVERLGMGFGGGISRESSHSVVSEMRTIEQESPSANTHRATLDSINSRSNNYDDDFEIIGGFSGPPKYNENPFGLKNEDKYSNWSNNKSSWDSADRFDNKTAADRYESKTAADRFDSKHAGAIEEISSHNKSTDDERGRSRRAYDVSDGDVAQKKFGNAKAISSDAYFGKHDPDLEMQQKLTSYSGSSGISSAELFGQQGGSASNRGNVDYYGGTGPDLADIKEGVKQGVSKVAGRLSNLANGVMNSLQDHYG